MSKKTFLLIIQILGDLFKKDKGFIAANSIKIVVSAASMLIMLIYPRLIIDSLMGVGSYSAYFWIIMMVASHFVVRLSLGLLERYIKIKNLQIIIHYSTSLYIKSMKMELSLMEKATIAEKRTLAASGLGNISNCVSNIFSLIQNIVSIIVLIFVILSLNIPLIALIMAGAILYLLFQHKIFKEDMNIHKQFGKLFTKWGYITDTAKNSENAKEIKFYNLVDWMSKKIHYFAGENRKILLDSTKLGLKKDIWKNIIGGVQNLLIYAYICVLALARRITIGEFVQYISAVSVFSDSFFGIVDNFMEISKNGTTINDYFEYIALEDMDDKSDQEFLSLDLPSDKGLKISIQDLWFKYPDTEDYILKGVNLDIEPNMALSLVGKNGAGKTTLIKLLLRFYKPEKGCIKINGVDINKLSITEYYKHLSVIFQDFKVFAFSILDNILMSQMENAGENRERALDSLKMSGFINDIEKMPDKENTFISKVFYDNGTELSGGMQQKLVLARAYFNQSNFIILDEPTAMLDPIQEYEIYKQFNDIIKNRTAIYISHRMSSSMFCDKIAVLDDGVIIEYGDHSELMEKKGLYFSLFDAQADNYRVKEG